MNSREWTESNPRKGLRYRRLACQLFDAFPPPSPDFGDDELDALFRPWDPDYDPTGKSIHSRANWVIKVRKAAEHSAMNEGHYEAFTLRPSGRGRWRTMPVPAAINLGVVLEPLRNAIRASKRQEQYFWQSVPYKHLTDDELARLRQSSAYIVHMLESCDLIMQHSFQIHDEIRRALTFQKPGVQSALPEHEEDEDED